MFTSKSHIFYFFIWQVLWLANENGIVYETIWNIDNIIKHIKLIFVTSDNGRWKRLMFRVFYWALSNLMYKYWILNVFTKRRKLKKTRHLSRSIEEKWLKTIEKCKIKISGSVCKDAYFWPRSIVRDVRKRKEIKNVRVINIQTIYLGGSC